MTEIDVLDRLTATCASLCGTRIYLGDSLVALEQDAYPALFVLHRADSAKSNPSQRGARQVITSQYGVYCVAERSRVKPADKVDRLATLRAAVMNALIGHRFAGTLTPMQYVAGERIQAEAAAAVWLDVFTVEDLLIVEAAP